MQNTRNRRGAMLEVSALALTGWAVAQVKDLNDAINKGGRQRMLSQRLAAFYLGASWGVDTATASAEMGKARDEFVKASQVLKSAPEATPAILSELQLVKTQFTFFRDGPAHAETFRHRPKGDGRRVHHQRAQPPSDG